MDTYERNTHAREEQADFYADEIVTIADTEPDAAIARVRIDARKWTAKQAAPQGLRRQATTRPGQRESAPHCHQVGGCKAGRRRLMVVVMVDGVGAPV